MPVGLENFDYNKELTHYFEKNFQGSKVMKINLCYDIRELKELENKFLELSVLGSVFDDFELEKLKDF